MRAFADIPKGLLLALAAAQLGLAAVFLVEPLAALGLVLAAAAVAVVVLAPGWGVALLVASRLVSTGALVFLRVGRVGVGPFELVLLACLVSLAVRAAVARQRLWLPWAWKAPFLAFTGWLALSLAWSVDRGDGLSELLPLLLILANTTLILAFTRTWAQVRALLAAWLGTCVFIGLASQAASSLGIQIGVSFEAASGGGRSTGLGQQPNWYAMNLFFIIAPALAMGVGERGWRRAAWLGGGAFVTLAMLQAGSRGGALATLIACGLTAAAHPRFRSWALGLGAGVLAAVALAVTFDVGGLNAVVVRLGKGIALQQNYRPWNWMACWEMFRDTGGLGIGAGGYQTLLPQYNHLLSQSLYDYPHGVFWELLAHFGVVGLALAAWLVVVVARMSARTARAARGHPAELLALAMPATLVGYVAWTFVEFSVSEKPSWEFLALLTALGAALETKGRDARV